jgi:predicted ATPase
MQLTRLSIENFKGVRDRVEVNLRPITLLFGANSVGKSTLLQALLYFRELLERQNVDADRLLVSGASIDLGGFRQFVHKHDLGRKVTIGVTVSADDDGLPLYPTPGLRLESNPLAESMGEPVYTATVEIEVAWDDGTARPWITAYRVGINDLRVGTISAEPGLKAGVTELDCNHDVFGFGPTAAPNERSELHTAISALWAEHSISGRTNRPANIPLGTSVIPTWGKTLPFLEDAATEAASSVNDETAITRAYAFCGLSSIFVGAGELILHHLQRLRYIGPLRTIPERGFLAQSSPSADRWADGSAAWDLLHKSAGGGEASDLLTKTSSMIADPDKLNLGYRLEGRTIYEVPARGFVVNTLQALARSAEDADIEARLKLVLDDLRSQPRRTQLALVDLKSDTEVDPIDIGAGVTQSIPIVVGVLDGQAGIVVVEQPELHTHPAVQCNLGDVFVRAVRSRQDRLFLIETHSEHLLLRLMKRIRQTAGGKTADPTLELRESDVAVVFVEPYEGQSIFREMPLNEHGELVKAWPGGFFEENLGELF